MDQKKLALIHIIKRDLHLTDEEYRDILHQAAGVNSSKDLTEEKFSRLMNYFMRSRHYRRHPNGITLRQKFFIKDLREALGWDDSHLENFLEKYYHRKQLDNLTKTDASKLIQSLINIKTHHKGRAPMIDLYYWPTPNAHKITIFCEESNLEYRVVPLDITQGKQFDPEFLKISPNNKIPAIVDHDSTLSQKPIAIFESGAILEYLADKTQKFLPPLGDPKRYAVLQWLYWQMADLGPMEGQNYHFTQFAKEKVPYAIERYAKETHRLYGVLNAQIASNDFVTGDQLTIADMAIYPWIVPHQKLGQNLDDFPNIKRWFKQMAQRPAVQKAYAQTDGIKK